MQGSVDGELVLHPVGEEHEAAVLAFEVVNRAYFSAFISDRGEAFFERFSQRHRELLERQEAGAGAYYLLVDGEEVMGRFNLTFVGNGVAEVGYRMAQRAAGRGLATAGLRELTRLAASRHHLSVLRAATSHANAASQRVLAKAGFVRLGPADPSALGGKQGSWYELDLGERSAR